jgi:site-specific DNA recombinase
MIKEISSVKKAVIYCRVSTKEQVEEGNSLSTQEKICREYALKNSYEIVEIFVEQGESAKTSNRPEFQRLLSYCSNKKNQVNAVIAYKIDRISRNTDDYSQIRILLKRLNVEIKSTSEYFENTPAGRFMENIISNVAQFDNDVRTERCVGGMKDAVREGRYIWLAPFGYSNVRVGAKSNIAPNEKASIVKAIFDDVARNIESLESIRLKYAREGFVGKARKPICKSYFYSMLRNELYCGRLRKFGECHAASFEPLITPELFEYVQLILNGKNNKKGVYLVQNPDFPLRRFLQYPKGSKLTGAWSQGRRKKYAYYRFLKPNIQFSKTILEEKFINFLNSYSISESGFKRLQKSVQTELSKQTRKDREYVQIQHKKLIELDELQSELYKKNHKGIISDDMLRRQLDRIESDEMLIKKTLLFFPSVDVDFDELLELVKDFFITPGVVWRKACFELKVKLQWFNFPGGITFDGKVFRTRKTSLYIKARSVILRDFSAVVDYPVTKTNTQQMPNSQNSLINKKEFWERFAQELIELDEIAKMSSLSTD